MEDVYTINDEGVIEFKYPYKFLFTLLYYPLHRSYLISNGKSSNNNYEIILKGKEWLLNNEGNPFIPLGIGSIHYITFTSNKDVTIGLYRFSMTSGRMIPILDTSSNLVNNVELKKDKAKTISVDSLASILVHVSTEVEIKLKIFSVSVNDYPIINHINGRIIKIIEMLPYPYSGLIDTVCPEFEVIDYLVQQSLLILSLPPPLLEDEFEAEADITIECKLVYDEGRIMSNVKPPYPNLPPSGIRLDKGINKVKLIEIKTVTSIPIDGLLQICTWGARNLYECINGPGIKIYNKDVVIENIDLNMTCNDIAVVIKLKEDVGFIVGECRLII